MLKISNGKTRLTRNLKKNAQGIQHVIIIDVIKHEQF
ncbi:hypothetical protein V461_10100 [Pantoea ananatis BRT98]|nr:hypothetical protein V461_10100 [Pantoea ananatis BRT98]